MDCLFYSSLSGPLSTENAFVKKQILLSLSSGRIRRALKRGPTGISVPTSWKSLVPGTENPFLLVFRNIQFARFLVKLEEPCSRNS